MWSQQGKSLGIAVQSAAGVDQTAEACLTMTPAALSRPDFKIHRDITLGGTGFGIGVVLAKFRKIILRFFTLLANNWP
jgi:hypothetical protein